MSAPQILLNSGDVASVGLQGQVIASIDGTYTGTQPIYFEALPAGSTSGNWVPVLGIPMDGIRVPESSNTPGANAAAAWLFDLPYQAFTNLRFRAGGSMGGSVNVTLTSLPPGTPRFNPPVATPAPSGAFSATSGVLSGSLTCGSLVSGGAAFTMTGAAAANATAAGGAIATAGAAGGATSGAGGAVSQTGGAGTAGNSAGGASSNVGGAGQGSAAGGVSSITGGAGGATGAGGAATIAGGIGGATSGTGGAATLTGGVGTAGNSAGGVASATGGAGQGSAAGGVGTVVGGVGGATGAGGACVLTGGAGGATSGTGGAFTAAGGAGAAGNSAGGAASVTGGAGQGTGAGGTLTLTAGASGAGATGNGGATAIAGGAATSTNGTGGAASLKGGVATGTGTGGALTLTAGASGGASGTAGAASLDAGAAAGGTGATVNIADVNAIATYIGRGPVKPPIVAVTLTSLGTNQNSTPTAAQILGGLLTQTGATGAGTVTLPTGTLLSAACARTPVAGDSFMVPFASLTGQALTITGATGTTVIGTAAIPSGKNALLFFVNTGVNTWNIYVVVSA
jgi:hypothetical protein